MTALAFLASVSGVIMGLAGVPQAIKIFRRKSAKDIAPLTYIIVEIGAVIWIFYGLELKIFPIVVGNILGFTTTSLILVGYYLYGRNKK